MHKIKFFKSLFLLINILCINISYSQDNLTVNFKNPPQEARPIAYWWWLNSQVTKQSITRDLEEMADKGYAGAILFDAGNSANNLVKKPLAGPVFASKEWTELWIHTLKEADRLGLVISANIQSGWNTGGPTVKPQYAMRRLFWKDTVINGNKMLNAKIPIPKADDFKLENVIAYKILNQVPTDNRITSITTSNEKNSINATFAFDGDISTYWESANKPTSENPEFIQFELFTAQKISSITINANQGFEPKEIEISTSDGIWSPNSIKKIKLNEPTQTINIDIPEKTYKILRISFNSSFNGRIRINSIFINETKSFRFGIFCWEYKSLNRQFGIMGGAEPLYLLRKEFAENENDINGFSKDVIDLTAKVDTNKILLWKVPQGEWRIITFGHGLHGAKVSTGSDGWEGLSFDHLNDKAFYQYMKDVMNPLLEAAKPYIGKSLKYLYSDSWEMGSPNWTWDFKQQFIKRRGYNPLPYLPVLTGEIIDSRDISNRFLYDFRKTVSDLIYERMYKTFAEYARKYGLKIHPESGGPHGAPIDAFKNLGINAFPQGEFWARSNTHRTTDDQRLFVKQAASVAHIYGKQWVAAEGPTSIGPHWERSPRELRNVFNDVYLEGLNRIIWHTFTNSPSEFGIPGNEYFAGTHLNPNTTWWPMTKPWLTYLARCNYLLSRGLFVADLLFYVGDDTPNFGKRKQNIEGLDISYDYDECNADVILNRLSVVDGNLVLPDGMKYKVLVLPNEKSITLNVLKKIEYLVKNGAIIVGPRPETSTGLKNYKQSEKEVQKIASKLWGNINGKTIFKNKYGKGTVYFGLTLNKILKEINIQPDFSFYSSLDSSQVGYIHRVYGDTDIYFIANRLAYKGIYDSKYRYAETLPNRYENIIAKFRTTGKIPEIFNPVNGETYQLSVYYDDNFNTSIPLRLDPDGCCFVIFRKKHQDFSVTNVKISDQSMFPDIKIHPDYFEDVRFFSNDNNHFLELFSNKPVEIIFGNGKYEIVNDFVPTEEILTGDWKVYFNSKWGGPDSIVFDSLYSWTKSDIDGIKYYSGIATYKKEIYINNTNNYKIYIDLGNIFEIAEIYVNGINCGTLFLPPFRADITGAIKNGTNALEIKVVNLWPNRIIGDLNSPENKRFTKTNVIKFKKNDNLRISGLIGPVTIKYSKIISIGE